MTQEKTDAAVDLFGNPVPQTKGRGRPAHVPTKETRDLVNMLFVCGHEVMAVAKSLGLKRTAFYQHYRNEIAARDHARLKFRGHQMLRLNRLAEGGNVSAEKALAGMIQVENTKAAERRVLNQKSPAKPLGKKQERQENASKVDGIFAPRSAPQHALN